MADVCGQCRQVRWRVLHAAGGTLELLARITVVGKKQVNKVYDRAVGSGSLLLKFDKVLGKNNVRQGFYGQEINLTNVQPCTDQHVPARRELCRLQSRPR